MANNIEPGSSLAELALTLDMSSVPEKLHCTSCRNFLVNAYKTTCCDSFICEKCFENIPSLCPQCNHSPFTQDLCRPNKASRGTAKAYLKAAEKKLADERAKTRQTEPVLADTPPQSELVAQVQPAPVATDLDGVVVDIHDPEQVAEQPLAPSNVYTSVEQDSPSTERLADETAAEEVVDSASKRQASVSSDENDDEVEIQVEPSGDEDYSQFQPATGMEEEEDNQNDEHARAEDNRDESVRSAEGGKLSQQDREVNTHANDFGMQNMPMNFQGMNGMSGMNGMNHSDMQQQYMQMMNMMNQFNNNMGLMSPGMFGGGMNPMMGMMSSNFQFGGFGQNNGWQNNNAYPSGMGNEYAQYPFNMSQQGNFDQQQFQNGNFQNGFPGFGRGGRGRGRNRGNHRGRGPFGQQYSQYNNFQACPTTNGQPPADSQRSHGGPVTEDGTDPQGAQHLDHDDFAPGGQDEAQEVLGDQYQKVDEVATEATSGVSESATNGHAEENEEPPNHLLEVTELRTNEVDVDIPEAYREDVDNMAPPSAPSGPSGRNVDRDFGFRSRGHGRFGARGRGSYQSLNGHPAMSPVRPVSQNPVVIAPGPVIGTGVVGAPTGPRAMREPQAPKPVTRPNGGFQIMGRASMQSQNQPRQDGRTRSPTPTRDIDERSDDRTPRRQSRQEKATTAAYEDNEDRYCRDDSGRKYKRSRKDYDNYPMHDADNHGSRSGSPERRSSRRDGRHDQDRERDRDRDRDRDRERSSKHRSSRKYLEDDLDGDEDMDDYGEPADTKSKYRNGGKSFRNEDRDRDRDRARDDRHRKRSRHDREREEDYEDEVEEESRHRSRKHRKDHHKKDRDRERGRGEDDYGDNDDHIGLRIKSSSTRKASVSALPTPTSAVASEPEKDPHTLEREARNRERMLKEQQRREKAALEKQGGQRSGRSTVSGGRRVSYKYEDEIERHMDERDSGRWR